MRSAPAIWRGLCTAQRLWSRRLLRIFPHSRGWWEERRSTKTRRRMIMSPLISGISLPKRRLWIIIAALCLEVMRKAEALAWERTGVWSAMFTEWRRAPLPGWIWERGSWMRTLFMRKWKKERAFWLAFRLTARTCPCMRFLIWCRWERLSRSIRTACRLWNCRCLQRPPLTVMTWRLALPAMV